MSDHVKVNLEFVYSTDADFAPALTRSGTASYVSSVVEELKYIRVEAGTSATSIPLVTMSSSIKTIVIVNRDPTNYVTVSMTSAAASGAFAQRVLPNNGFFCSQDVQLAAGLSLVANGSPCVVDIWVAA